jgi:hypothetical protein
VPDSQISVGFFSVKVAAAFTSSSRKHPRLLLTHY